MDFEKVNAAIGQMDGRFPVRIAMKGKVDSPDKVKYAEEGGKPTQQVWITDGPGIRNRVKIDGNFPDLTRMDLEQLLDFKICGYKSKHDGKIYYKGWCDVPDDRQGPTTEPTPNTRYDYKPKGGQQPAADKPDWDAKDERIVRQNTLNRAVEIWLESERKANKPVILWPLKLETAQEIMSLAENFKVYVYNGPLSPGDQFARDQGIPTAAEEAAMEAARSQQDNQPPF